MHPRGGEGLRPVEAFGEGMACLSVATLTRQDGLEFLALAAVLVALLARLREGRVTGA